MNILDFLKESVQEHPFVYDAIVVLLTLFVCIIADLMVKKILLRGLKQLFNRFIDNAEDSLVLKMAARIANVVPAIIIYFVPDFFSNANKYVKLFL